jgi:DNA-binding transcriptional ArsR family regulator
MTDFKSRPGTFLPFMEYAKREKLYERPATASPLTLLEILSRQAQQSLPLFDLQSQGNMEPGRYSEALKSLRNAGYIAIEGDGLDQVVRLNASGAEVVRLARPD